MLSAPPCLLQDLQLEQFSALLPNKSTQRARAEVPGPGWLCWAPTLKQWENSEGTRRRKVLLLGYNFFNLAIFILHFSLLEKFPDL